jgi:hypothetical protein
VDPWQVFINRIFDAAELILRRANTIIPSLVLLGTTVAILYGRVILRHQKEAKVERADLSAKVDGLTSQAIATAGDAGFVQGAASVTDPAVAERKAIDMLATAAGKAQDIVTDAAATAAALKDSP